MTTYFWDFYGPDAEGTARHFLVHLGEYAARNALELDASGVSAEATGHWAAWCKAADRARDALLRLRPRRTRAG